MESPKRETWLDLGRVISLLIIVTRHTYVYGSIAEYIQPFFYQRLPFLFLAAGYFVGRRSSFEIEHSPCRYMPLYLIWNFIALILISGYHLVNFSFTELPPIQNILPRLLGVGMAPWNFPCWFLRDVMLLSLCYPIFKLLNEKKLILPIISLLIVYDLTFFQASNSTVLLDPINHHSIAWATIYGLGFYLGKFSLTNIKKLLEKISHYILPLFLIGGLSQLLGLYDIKNYTILYYLWGVLGLSCLCIYLCKIKIFSSIASACSSIFFLVFASNWAIITLLQVFFPNLSLTFWYFFPVLLFIICYYFYTFINNYLPHLSYWIFGVKSSTTYRTLSKNKILHRPHIN